MHITILKENLHKALALVGKFTATKAQLPVLSHVGLVASTEGIFLLGTDLDVGVRVRVGGKMIEAGEIAVPAKLLMDLASQLPLGPVELRASKSHLLTVKAGRVEATVAGMGMAEFPPVAADEEGGVTLGEYAVADLERALVQVEYALSRDESRPVLTGILWELKRGAWVATDGYRLSLVGQAVKTIDKPPEKTMLLSGRMLLDGVRALSDLGAEKVTVQYYEAHKQIRLENGEAVVVGRVLSGEFPNYGGILPGELLVQAEVDREEFLAAVRTAAIFARDSAHIVKLAVEKNTLVVSANAPQVGENRVEVEVKPVKPGKVEIAFNSRYLIDCLSRMGVERIQCGFIEALKPGVFWEKEREVFQHVIMPVRVRGAE